MKQILQPRWNPPAPPVEILIDSDLNFFLRSGIQYNIEILNFQNTRKPNKILHQVYQIIPVIIKLAAIDIKVIIIHNLSILTAVGVVGLELYKYGKTTSIPFENKDVNTPIEVIKQNKKNGLHSLVLLDLKPEQDRFMSIYCALKYLVD